MFSSGPYGERREIKELSGSGKPSGQMRREVSLPNVPDRRGRCLHRDLEFAWQELFQ